MKKQRTYQRILGISLTVIFGLGLGLDSVAGDWEGQRKLLPITIEDDMKQETLDILRKLTHKGQIGESPSKIKCGSHAEKGLLTLLNDTEEKVRNFERRKAKQQLTTILTQATEPKEATHFFVWMNSPELAEQIREIGEIAFKRNDGLGLNLRGDIVDRLLKNAARAPEVNRKVIEIQPAHTHRTKKEAVFNVTVRAMRPGTETLPREEALKSTVKIKMAVAFDTETGKFKRSWVWKTPDDTTYADSGLKAKVEHEQGMWEDSIGRKIKNMEWLAQKTAKYIMACQSARYSQDEGYQAAINNAAVKHLNQTGYGHTLNCVHCGSRQNYIFKMNSGFGGFTYK